MKILSNVIADVSAYTGITEKQIKSVSRKGPIKNARHLVCYIAYEVLGISCIYIGDNLNRDHSTILNACNVVNNNIELTGHVQLILDTYDYNKVISPENKYVKQLSDKINQLESQLKSLMLRVNNLENKLTEEKQRSLRLALNTGFLLKNQLMIARINYTRPQLYSYQISILDCPARFSVVEACYKNW
jgi:hypothetical protein